MTGPSTSGADPSPGHETFDRHRRLLFSVAYRILGSAADAEDAVQDAWIAWAAADRSGVADPRAYLTRIASNEALARLRSAQRRRETYVGPWLPEPVRTPVGTGENSGTTDVADTVVTAESVSMAMLVVLETLSPLERAVFVLREVFDVSHAEIADTLDRSETAVRQAAHRARDHVQARRPRFPVEPHRHREITERFRTALTGGDVNVLLDMLAPEVTLWTDGGGRVRQALRPITGADTVARWFAAIGATTYQGVAPADMSALLIELNGGPGILFTAPDRVIATITLDLDTDGRITQIHNVANPDKLHAVQAGTTHDLTVD